MRVTVAEAGEVMGIIPDFEDRWRTLGDWEYGSGGRERG